MAKGVKPMASEHKRIVERLEALERLSEGDRELRRIHCDHHNRLGERQKNLESNLSALRRSLDEHYHADLAARLGRQLSVLGKRADMARDSISDLDRRLAELDARLSSKPDDFGGVTSTGAPKRERRFMVVKDHGLALSRENGYVRRCAAANPACVPPVLFERLEDAGEIIRLLDLRDAEIEPVEVIERDGRLIEARYA